ncbi:hypothetical protein AAG906_010495 [Vitis piasezkii]
MKVGLRRSNRPRPEAASVLNHAIAEAVIGITGNHALHVAATLPAPRACISCQDRAFSNSSLQAKALELLLVVEKI